MLKSHSECAHGLAPTVQQPAVGKMSGNSLSQFTTSTVVAEDEDVVVGDDGDGEPYFIVEETCVDTDHQLSDIILV